MLKTKRKIFKLLSIIPCLALLSSCSVFQRDMGRAEAYDVVSINSEDDMKDDSYYVKKKDGTFHELYIGNTNFNKSSITYSSPERVAWYGKDFDKIPTMYKDESLVYYVTSEFNERMRVERFVDTGFTIGLAGLTKTETGRYSFSTSPSDFYMDINSSAGQMYQLGDQIAVLDTIGNAKLREGNISPSGTIVGLEEGKTYSAYVYVGTQAHHYNIVADVRALVSSEYVELWDFEYNKSKTLEIKFPNYFNSGYYFVNGYGLVRYIDSNKEWDESMDMNIPNIYEEDNGENREDDSTQGKEQDLEAQTIEKIPVEITEDGKYNVEVNFEVIEGMPKPAAKIIGPNGAITLNPSGDNLLAIQTDLSAGDYELQLIGLDGRFYTYKIVNTSSNEEADTEPIETESTQTKPTEVESTQTESTQTEPMETEIEENKDTKPQESEEEDVEIKEDSNAEDNTEDGEESTADKIKKALEGNP